MYVLLPSLSFARLAHDAHAPKTPERILSVPRARTGPSPHVHRYPPHQDGKDHLRDALNTQRSRILFQLLGYDPAKALPVSSFPLSVLPEAAPSINCFQALDYL
jgi:hypothetical protein